MHECIIGLARSYEDNDFITMSDLLDCYRHPESNYSAINPKHYSLNDYLDRRKNTNLYQFNFCPECGKEINWKDLRNEAKNL